MKASKFYTSELIGYALIFFILLNFFIYWNLQKTVSYNENITFYVYYLL